jgi:ABC-2 type transport system permease protein
MENLKKNLKLFTLYSRMSFRTIFQAKSGVFFFLLGKLMRFFFLFFFIFFLFSRTKLIKGYDLNQVMIFFLTYTLIDNLSQMLFREVYRFRPLVLSGALDLILLKPHHPFLRILIGGIDFLDMLLIVPYVILIFIVGARIPHIGLVNIFNYSFLIFNSLLIATAFHIIVLALGILTTEVDHTIMIYRDMTSVGRFPLDIYREPIRSIFTYVIPVGIMIGFPSKALFNLLAAPFIMLSFVVSWTLLYLSIKLWHHALMKYQSWGG